MPATAWHRLGDYLHETRLLGSIQNTLYWDQNTRMPSGGSCWRGEQLSLLAKYLHARQSCSQFEELIQAAKAEFKNDSDLSELDSSEILERRKNIELLEQDLSRQKSLDSELVVHLAKAKAEGYDLWQQARNDNNFQTFAPALRKLIQLRKEQSRQLAEGSSDWETLAQPFEPGLTISRLQELFAPLRNRLPELIEATSNRRNHSSCNWDLCEKSQSDLCDLLLKSWGRDLNVTAIARSPHPFSITLGPKDFRLTTRIVKGQPLSCFLATAHEWGHSLYEQGLPSQTHQWFSWPLSQATSMAVHESQSLFWENRVARSHAFSQKFWPYFAQAGAPVNSGLDLWKIMNPLTPGLNRVEADELSYGIHILIRTDLEIALIDMDMSVDDLPHEWNHRYSDLLGLNPKNDVEGCLQDVHWSEGMFGYFPSYLIGHLISAQFTDAMKIELRKQGMEETDPVEECISNGQESMLLAWLRKQVHPHGRLMNAEELVEHVTGKPLSSKAFLNYLEAKLYKLQGIS